MKSPYNADALTRLLWAHADERRLAAILAGRDAATEEDLRRWRQLGRSASRAAE